MLLSDGVSVRLLYTRPETDMDRLFDEQDNDLDGMDGAEPAYIRNARQDVPVVDVHNPRRKGVYIDLGHARPITARVYVAGEVTGTVVIRNAAYREQSGQNKARRTLARLRERAGDDYKAVAALDKAAPRGTAAIAQHLAALRASRDARAAYHTSVKRKRVEFRKVCGVAAARRLGGVWCGAVGAAATARQWRRVRAARWRLTGGARSCRTRRGGWTTRPRPWWRGPRAWTRWTW